MCSKSATIRSVLVQCSRACSTDNNQLVFKVFHAQQGDLNLPLSPPRFTKLLAAGVVSCQKQIPYQSVNPVVINGHSSAAGFLFIGERHQPNLGMTTHFFPQVRPAGLAQHIAHRGRLVTPICYSTSDLHITVGIITVRFVRTDSHAPSLPVMSLKMKK